MRGWLLLALLALSGWVHATERGELRLDVTGDVGIDQQGRVFDCEIKTILTPEVKSLVERTVRQWRFHPVLVDGKPALAKSGMHLNLLARPVAEGYQLTVERVRFVGSRVAAMMVPPAYPREAMRQQVSASVLMALRVDAAGEVADAIAVDAALINARGSEKVISQWRQKFELASVTAARQWKYRPADVQAGDQADITLLLPVVFCAPRGDDCGPAGTWRRDTGAMRRAIPWLDAGSQGFDIEALSQGRPIALDSQVRLLHEVKGAIL